MASWDDWACAPVTLVMLAHHPCSASLVLKRKKRRRAELVDVDCDGSFGMIVLDKQGHMRIALSDERWSVLLLDLSECNIPTRVDFVRQTPGVNHS